MEPKLRLATLEDLRGLLALQRAYYAEDGYPFVEEVARSCWQDFLADPALGRAWVAEAGLGLVGYAVLTLGYSLEYGGPDAFVDELYVAPAFRGRGIARRALSLLEADCGERGVKALHLEVERGNETARRLYRRWGFADKERVLMTKRLREEG
jgi:ribosomal protein S18 acetylase RimI-like enzyme